MKSLFMVGAKLLGIVFIAKAINSFSMICTTFGFAGTEDFNFISVSIPILLSIVIYMIFGYMLAFKTEVVSKIVGVSKLNDELPALSIRDSLKTGIILIGLFYLILYLPNIIEYFGYKLGGQNQSLYLVIDKFIGSIIAIALIFYSDKILSMVYKNNK